jgi:hypothetical protein
MRLDISCPFEAFVAKEKIESDEYTNIIFYLVGLISW